MLEKLIIIGSASLTDKIRTWQLFYTTKGFTVTNYPKEIPPETFDRDYPAVHAQFMRDLEQADVVFVMNENKNGLSGYIGAETFAELAFVVAQNLIHGKRAEILLWQMPDKAVQSYSEIILWFKLGWIKLYNGNQT